MALSHAGNSIPRVPIDTDQRAASARLASTIEIHDYSVFVCSPHFPPRLDDSVPKESFDSSAATTTVTSSGAFATGARPTYRARPKSVRHYSAFVAKEFMAITACVLASAVEPV